jgi:4'-phosphopantetheinyl transferase
MTWWLTRSLGDVPAGELWLGPSERAALAPLRIEKRRADWRLGRYAAKAAIGAWLGVERGRVEVLAAPSGAPVARVDGVRAELELSISHRAGRALAVLASPGTTVGCDIELIEPRSAAFVEQWLAPTEQALVNGAHEDEQACLANLIWSAKEAAAKARGEGLRLDVRHAEVALGEPAGRPGHWRPLRVDWGSDRDYGWYLREPEWVITVVGGERSAPRALTEPIGTRLVC